METLREKILEVQKNLCPYCNEPFTKVKPTNHHRDHNHQNCYEDNIIVCCEWCHRNMNTVETIFKKASDRLRQEMLYSILLFAPPPLSNELMPSSLHEKI